jgi:hypothetical protein
MKLKKPGKLGAGILLRFADIMVGVSVVRRSLK